MEVLWLVLLALSVTVTRGAVSDCLEGSSVTAGLFEGEPVTFCFFLGVVESSGLAIKSKMVAETTVNGELRLSVPGFQDLGKAYLDPIDQGYVYVWAGLNNGGEIVARNCAGGEFLGSSCLQTYMRKNLTIAQPLYTVPFNNLIVRVEHGLTVGLDWDNKCMLKVCGEKKELTEACVASPLNSTLVEQSAVPGYPNQDGGMCGQQCGEDGACPAKFYMTWQGTDAQSRELSSASISYTKFEAFGIKRVHAAMAEL